MKVNVYCIKDNLIGFKTPFCELNDEVAIRGFVNSIENEYRGEAHSPLFDMSLYKVGSFDSVTGLIDSCESPIFLNSGVLVVSNLGGDLDANE